jgi:ABC-type multidrug transport system fused ATPase/permease subunit
MAFNTTVRWLSTRLEMLGACVVLAVALLSWALSDQVAGAFSGLALLWSQNLTISMNFNSTYVVATEAAAVSIQRVLEYADGLEREAPLREGGPRKAGDGDWDGDAAVVKAGPVADAEDPDVKAARARARAPTAEVDADFALGAAGVGGASAHSSSASSSDAVVVRTSAPWPPSGRVRFSDVCLRYRPGLPLALAGLSVEVLPGEFVAIVGRTGSGKSTIAAALFRLVEVAAGAVEVDGADVRSVGLSGVRGGAMACVPQDPVLFHGDLRSNLDPFGASTDEEVWGALEAVHLADVFRGAPAAGKAAGGGGGGGGGGAPLPPPPSSSPRPVVVGGGLSTPVTEDSLSLGQKQLLCLGRALLRNPRVLVLDEATASVDAATDRAILRVVRERFTERGVTVLCIAHRLHTVIEAHRVLVMEKGKQAEFGSPHALLADEGGVFAGLVRACGPAVEASLRAAAAKAAKGRGVKE